MLLPRFRRSWTFDHGTPEQGRGWGGCGRTVYCACVVGLGGRGGVVMWGGAVEGGALHALFFRVFCYKILKCKSL